MDISSFVEKKVLESIDVKKKFLKEQLPSLLKATNICKDAIVSGKKIILCGNGGSAADCQHFAAELVVRFKKNRKAVPSIALTVDTSVLTACGNDFGYDTVFSRQIQALGEKGDVLIAISTSGNSENVIKAIDVAKEMGIKVIGLTGGKESRMDKLVDVCIKVPSTITARIQEVHILCLHIIAECIEMEVIDE